VFRRRSMPHTPIFCRAGMLLIAIGVGSVSHYPAVAGNDERQRPGAVPWWRLKAAAKENSDA
jgi:hypothetical protein